MSVALLLIGNGRIDYIVQAVNSIKRYLPPSQQTFSHRLMVDDSGNPEIADLLDAIYPNFTISHHPTNLGMAAAVQSGFDMVLATDATHVLWQEEDFIWLATPPIDRTIRALDAYPTVAQMLYQRQPLTPSEEEGGTVLSAMNPFADHGQWSEQRHIFSLNPCVIPRHILEHGWPTDNERGMTDELLTANYTFGVWHNQYVEHIGIERGPAWQL